MRVLKFNFYVSTYKTRAFTGGKKSKFYVYNLNISFFHDPEKNPYLNSFTIAESVNAHQIISLLCSDLRIRNVKRSKGI